MTTILFTSSFALLTLMVEIEHAGIFLNPLCRECGEGMVIQEVAQDRFAWWCWRNGHPDKEIM